MSGKVRMSDDINETLRWKFVSSPYILGFGRIYVDLIREKSHIVLFLIYRDIGVKILYHKNFELS